MNNHFYQLLDFPAYDTKNGVLAMFQGADTLSDRALPFPIKRVLCIKGMRADDARGGHTHHKTRQVLLALSGACNVDLDNGHGEKTTVRLEKFNTGLLLEPYVWHVMKDFEDGTVLLVLASTPYDERDYIKDYNEFLKLVAQQQ